MNILNINSYYFSSSVHEELSRNLNNNYNYTSFVPVNYKYEVRKDYNFKENNNVIKCECYYKIERYIFHLKHFKIWKKASSFINFNNYDIVHSSSLFSNGYIAYKIFEKYNIPYVVTVRDTDFSVFFRKRLFIRKLGIKILNNASKVIFLSESLKNQLIDKYISKSNKTHIYDKSIVIPNGVGDIWFANRNNSKAVLDEKIKLIYVGDISYRKNITKTLEAIKYLNEVGITCSLTCVGKIVDKKLFNRIKDNRFLNYLGILNRNEVLKEYRKHDIFVMPSIRETFGLVYAEAMSQGLPVIYTKNQGFDKQFEDGEVGYSVYPQDYVDIAKKIKLIIENYSIISSNAIRNAIKFDWNIIKQEYSKIFNEIDNRNMVF